jgi:hypothetical protein
MLNNRWTKLALAFLGFLLAVGLAAGTRWQAVRHLPVDYDEDDYLLAAQQYAALIRAGDWAGFTETNYRPEHPPLSKILYALAILPAPEAPLLADRSTTAEPNQYLPLPQRRNARTLAAVFGVLEVALLALVNPLAGLFLGIHTFTIKYTSQIMLEAFPSLTPGGRPLLPALEAARLSGGLRRWPQASALVPGRRQTRWLVASALFLGLTAASKYLYCVVGVAIIIDWVIESSRNEEFYRRNIRRFLAPFLLWGGLAVLIFFLADPYLWPDPLMRLKESVFYHAGYFSTAGRGGQLFCAHYSACRACTWTESSIARLVTLLACSSAALGSAVCSLAVGRLPISATNGRKVILGQITSSQNLRRQGACISAPPRTGRCHGDREVRRESAACACPGSSGLGLRPAGLSSRLPGRHVHDGLQRHLDPGRHQRRGLARGLAGDHRPG